MAGDLIVEGHTSCREHGVGGLPLVTIITNGKVEEGDKWALLRLTDEAYSLCQEGPDFRASILEMTISGKPSYAEVSRHDTKELALEAKGQLTPEEQARTLIRSVRPD